VLQKLFPSSVGTPPMSSFKLIFLAEGYQALHQSDFKSACADFYAWLIATPPFNSTRYNPGWLTVYAGFQASTATGPAPAGTTPANRTTFDSALSAAGVLTVDSAKVVAVLDAENLQEGGIAQGLSGFLAKGHQTYGRTGALVVLLLPAATPAGAEMAYVPAVGEYHFIAVTQNGLWQQVVLRAMCDVLGLGDEFELAGTDFLEPTTAEEIALLPFNLEYFDTLPTTNGVSPGWNRLFGPGRAAAPAIVHASSGSPAPLDTNPMTPETVEFWEGGGGFRTKIYRTAKDCLMRRQFGNPAHLPLTSAPVPLCLACSTFLRDAIG